MDIIGDIPVVIAVAETHGFAAAARQLGVSKSAVSKRISAIEHKLGAQLFHRSTRHIHLTEAGQNFYDHALRAHQAAQDALDSVLALQTSPRGRLKVNVPMAFGRQHVSPLIPKFLKTYPNIELDLMMEDRVVDLYAEGYDLALRGGTLPDSSLVARRIAPIHNVLVAAPHYLDAHGAPTSLEDLAHHNCLQYSISRDFQEWRFRLKDKTQSFRPNGNYRVNNGEALLEAILMGLGIGRLPTFTVGADLRAGKLARVLSQYPIPTQAMYAIYPERRHLPTTVRLFIDFIIEHIGGDTPPWDEQIKL